MHFSAACALYLTLGVVSAIPRQHPRQNQASRPCYQDNPLRALEGLSSEASVFCPKYLATTGVALPSQFTQWQGARLTSACSCFEKTAAPAKPTTTSSTKRPPKPTSPTTTSTTVAPPVTPPAVPKTTSSSTSTTSTTSSTSVPVVAKSTGGSAKRGLVYDYSSKNSFFNFFSGSQYVGFGSNWGDSRTTNGITLPNTWNFVPTLRVDGNLQSSTWNSDANAAIKSGAKWLFASNEPDNAGQANLSPANAAKVYKQYMQPFKGQALLATPAVTNGGGETGLNYLGEFVGNCTGCHFDIINIHHYVQRSDMSVDQGVAALKAYIQQNVPALQAKYPSLQNLPIMIGEFWLWGASTSEGGTYLQGILPYLDCNPNIIGYQAFGGLWPGNFITSDGSGLTPAGTAYKSYYKSLSTCS